MHDHGQRIRAESATVLRYRFSDLQGMLESAGLGIVASYRNQGFSFEIDILYGLGSLHSLIELAQFSVHLGYFKPGICFPHGILSSSDCRDGLTQEFFGLLGLPDFRILTRYLSQGSSFDRATLHGSYRVTQPTQKPSPASFHQRSLLNDASSLQELCEEFTGFRFVA